MFRRALRALGPGRDNSAVGARRVLVLKKQSYPSPASAESQAGTHRATVRAAERGSVRAADRRRRNLTGLAVFIIVTFVLGLLPGLGFFLFVNLVADILFIAYLAAAVYFANRPTQPQRHVASVPHEQVSPPTVAGGA